MNVISRTMSWTYDAYNSQLPPPLCFTVPAGSRSTSSKVLYTSPGLKVTLRVPQVEMDPSNPSTWQREYLFDTGKHGIMPGRYPAAAGMRWGA